VQDNTQAILRSADSAAQPKPKNERWQTLIAMHHTLRQQNHEFIVPTISFHGQALRRSVSKSSLLPRIWRHGIHSFLGLAFLDIMILFTCSVLLDPDYRPSSVARADGSALASSSECKNTSALSACMRCGSYLHVGRDRAAGRRFITRTPR